MSYVLTLLRYSSVKNDILFALAEYRIYVLRILRFKTVDLSSFLYLLKSFGPVDKATPQQVITTSFLISHYNHHYLRYLLKKESDLSQASSELVCNKLASFH